MLFSFPAGTKMFQFPALASIIDGCYLFKVTGCPIRRFTDQGLFAPPRDLSQLITSFIGFLCQGIHRLPLPSSFRWFEHTFCTLIITYQMRSDAIFLKKIEFLFVTLCSSQGTRGRTLETEYCALSCNKDINGKDGNYSSKKLVLSLLKRVSP